MSPIEQDFAHLESKGYTIHRYEFANPCSGISIAKGDSDPYYYGHGATWEAAAEEALCRFRERTVITE